MRRSRPSPLSASTSWRCSTSAGARPSDDLLTSLVETRDSDDRLTDEEIASTAILLFAAGFETTTNLLGNGLLALLTHPDQMQDWRTHPEIARDRRGGVAAFRQPRAVQPAHRAGAGGPGGRAPRWGDRVVVLQGAANRDPRRYEDPDTLDLRRGDNVPLSFGWGVHHCIGAPLARMEGEIAFNALLARFSSLELLDAEPHWRPSFTLRGLVDLPLRVSGH